MKAEIFDYQLHGNIAVLTIDSPPINALGIDVRTSIFSGFERANKDPEVNAIILICAGRTFHPGADIREFGKPPQQPDLRGLIEFIESIDKLSVAAIHGTALGGGLELSLGFHRRIATSTAKVGLPEVNLGILPGAGGTQKLPRLIGVQKALEFMCSGRMIGASEACELGIIDELSKGENLLNDALAYTQRLLNSNEPHTHVRDLPSDLDEVNNNPEIFDNFAKANAAKFRGFLAPGHIIESVKASVTMPFQEGMIRERELFIELVNSSHSSAQRYAFFAERETSKIPDIPKNTPVREIKQVAVIGAGTMGGGIAMNFLNAGLPVTLMEREQDALDRGIQVIRTNYERSLKSGKLTVQQIDDRMALITPTLNMSDLNTADLIIEAVFEELSIKKAVFSQLNQVAKPDCILASNTSYLDLDEIADQTSRPQDVVGMHFFSPANIMPLLEVVRGKKTNIEVINTAMQLAKKINKTPVLSRVCNGFIANRIMTVRSIQANKLMMQGISPEDIDRVIYDYGFAMGPFAMRDLVGLDVIGRDDDKKTVAGELVKLDRLGLKKNGGFYDYDENRKRTISPIALKVIADLAAEFEIEQIACDDDEILTRLLYPVVNEGAKVLAEGIAIRSSDIDIACIKGYNWPVYHGGPMHWANTIGLNKVLDGLRDLEQRFGEEFTPSPYLIQLVEEGKTF